MEDVKRIFDIAEYAGKQFGEQKAFIQKQKGEWISYSYLDYLRFGKQVSLSLLNSGIKKGVKIGSITNNRSEWHFLDLGILQIGAVHVSLYPTFSSSDLIYVLNHAEVEIVFVSGKSISNLLHKLKPKLPFLKAIYTFDDSSENESFSDFLDLAEQPDEKLINQLDELKESISEHDIASIMYTSGTAFQPKGVLVTHENAVDSAINTHKCLPLEPGDTALSFLPLCHAYERSHNYTYIYGGVSICFAENMASIMSNFIEVEPHFFTSVPALLEKIYENIIGRKNSLPEPVKANYTEMLETASHFNFEDIEGTYTSSVWKEMDEKWFQKLRNLFGSRLKAISSAGAPLSPEHCRFYWGIGIPVYECYGLTECIGVTYSSANSVKPGTVGVAMEHVALKTLSDREILVKGSSVSPGYYKDEKWTKKLFDKDGWFHTGDLGYIDKSGFLVIDGRKKDLFKAPNGKYVSPEEIEKKLKVSPLISNILVYEDSRVIKAIIIPEMRAFAEKDHDSQYSGNIRSTDPEPLNNMIMQEISRLYNHLVPEAERINSCTLLENEWTIESGELTPTMKLKREFILKKYLSGLS